MDISRSELSLLVEVELPHIKLITSLFEEADLRYMHLRPGSSAACEHVLIDMRPKWAQYMHVSIDGNSIIVCIEQHQDLALGV